MDGTVAPTWDWAAIPDLFSGKAGYPGMNLQIAATRGGRWPPSARTRCTAPATTPTPSPPPASKDLLPALRLPPTSATPARWHRHRPVPHPARPPLHDSQAAFNKELSFRAAAERAVASVKT